MTILIVDDDKNLRFFLKSMVLELLDEEETSILEAVDGAGLISYVSENSPDIAFVDIMMPGMDGLHAIEIAKSINSSTQYVILSGYTDFAYARKGIALGVMDYLTKPVQKQELSQVLEKAKNQIKRSRQYANSMLQSDVFSILNFGSSASTKTMLFDSPENYFHTFCFHIIAEGNDATVLREAGRYLVMGMRSFFQDHQCDYDGYCSFYLEDGSPLLIINSDDHFLPLLKNRFQTLDIPRCRVAASHTARKNLVDAVTDAKAMDSDRGYALAHQDRSIEEFKGADEALSNLASILEHDSNSDACIPDLSDPILRDGVALMLNNRGASKEELAAMITGNTTEEDAGEIEDGAIRYMGRNYMNCIGVRDIADKLGITPNYLSSLFRKRTGKKLGEYLLQVRMEKAMALLRHNRSASVKNIAIMVGIPNTRYFSTLFKSYYGMLPTQVRDGQTES